MSMNFGASNSDTKSNSETNQQRDPWAPAQGTLKDLITQINGDMSSVGATDAQTSAIQQLEANAANGNPWAGQIGDLASKAFGAQSYSGTAGDAYKTAQSQLGDYATGKNLDFENNPYIKEMLKNAGDDAMNRVNAMFAGAGRDLSGANQAVVAREVTKAQTPILAQLYQDEQNKSIDAAKTLANLGITTANTQQGLDTQALQNNQAGVQLADSALTAQNYAPTQLLNLEQLMKNIPLEDQSKILSLIGPIAGLGGTTNQQSSGKSSTSTMSVGGGFTLI